MSLTELLPLLLLLLQQHSLNSNMLLCKWLGRGAGERPENFASLFHRNIGRVPMLILPCYLVWPDKYLVPNTYNVKCSMPKIPECPAASGCILQDASQHAFLAMLMENPLHSRWYITSTELHESTVVAYVIILCTLLATLWTL